MLHLNQLSLMDVITQNSQAATKLYHGGGGGGGGNMTTLNKLFKASGTRCPSRHLLDGFTVAPNSNLADKFVKQSGTIQYLMADGYH